MGERRQGWTFAVFLSGRRAFRGTDWPARGATFLPPHDSSGTVTEPEFTRDAQHRKGRARDAEGEVQLAIERDRQALDPHFLSAARSGDGAYRHRSSPAAGVALERWQYLA